MTKEFQDFSKSNKPAFPKAAARTGKYPVEQASVKHKAGGILAGKPQISASAINNNNSRAGASASERVGASLKGPGPVVSGGVLASTTKSEKSPAAVSDFASRRGSGAGGEPKAPWEYIPACLPADNKGKKGGGDLGFFPAPELKERLEEQGLRVLADSSALESFEGVSHKARLVSKMAGALIPGSWTADEEEEFFKNLSCRIHRCGSAVNSMLLRWNSGEKLRTFGLRPCKSAMCLICAEKKRDSLLGEISKVNEYWLQKNNGTDGKKIKTKGKKWHEINFLTLTVKRDYDEGLKDSGRNFNLLSEATAIYNKRYAEKVKEYTGVRSYFRRIEATAGITGMHYHMHALLYRSYIAGGEHDQNSYELSKIIWKYWNKAVIDTLKKGIGPKKIIDMVKNHKGDEELKIIEPPRPEYDKNGNFLRLKGGVVLEKCNKYSGDEIARYMLKTEKEREKYKKDAGFRADLESKNNKAVQNATKKYTLEVASTVTKVKKDDISSWNMDKVSKERFSIFDLPKLLDSSDKKVRIFARMAIRRYARDITNSSEIAWSYVVHGGKRMTFKTYIMKYELGSIDCETEAKKDYYSIMSKNRFDKNKDFETIDLEDLSKTKNKRGSFVYDEDLDKESADKIISEQKEIYTKKLRLGKVRKQKNELTEAGYKNKMGGDIFKWLQAIGCDKGLEKNVFGLKQKKVLNKKLVEMLSENNVLIKIFREEFLNYSRQSRKMKTYFEESFLTIAEIEKTQNEIKKREEEIQKIAEEKMDKMTKEEKEVEEMVSDQYKIDQTPDWPEFRKIMGMDSHDTDMIIVDLHQMGYREEQFLSAAGDEKEMWKDWDLVTTRHAYSSDNSPFLSNYKKMTINSE